jgi:hypothetical protein
MIWVCCQSDSEFPASHNNYISYPSQLTITLIHHTKTWLIREFDVFYIHRHLSFYCLQCYWFVILVLFIIFAQCMLGHLWHNIHNILYHLLISYCLVIDPRLISFKIHRGIFHANFATSIQPCQTTIYFTNCIYWACNPYIVYLVFATIN